MITDAVLLVCATILAAMKIIPSTAWLGIAMTIAGARAANLRALAAKPPAPPAPPGKPDGAEQRPTATDAVKRDILQSGAVAVFLGIGAAIWTVYFSNEHKGA